MALYVTACMRLQYVEPSVNVKCAIHSYIHGPLHIHIYICIHGYIFICICNYMYLYLYLDIYGVGSECRLV